MSGLRAALEELHFLDESAPGFRVCDNDEHTWPCDTARLLAAHPVNQAGEYTKADLDAAIHEAYVNAQRAVAALNLDGATVGYRHGRETMQEDAVRAIREAAEENR